MDDAVWCGVFTDHFDRTWDNLISRAAQLVVWDGPGHSQLVNQTLSKFSLEDPSICPRMLFELCMSTVHHAQEQSIARAQRLIQQLS